MSSPSGSNPEALSIAIGALLAVAEGDGVAVGVGVTVTAGALAVTVGAGAPSAERLIPSPRLRTLQAPMPSATTTKIATTVRTNLDWSRVGARAVEAGSRGAGGSTGSSLTHSASGSVRGVP